MLWIIRELRSRSFLIPGTRLDRLLRGCQSFEEKNKGSEVIPKKGSEFFYIYFHVFYIFIERDWNPCFLSLFWWQNRKMKYIPYMEDLVGKEGSHGTSFSTLKLNHFSPKINGYHILYTYYFYTILLYCTFSRSLTREYFTTCHICVS